MLGVSLAVGRLLPDVAHLPHTPFLVLGVAWALLSAAFVIVGSLRHRLGHRAIASGGFLHLDDRLTNALGAYMLALWSCDWRDVVVEVLSELRW